MRIKGMSLEKEGFGSNAEGEAAQSYPIPSLSARQETKSVPDEEVWEQRQRCMECNFRALKKKAGFQDLSARKVRARRISGHWNRQERCQKIS